MQTMNNSCDTESTRMCDRKKIFARRAAGTDPQCELLKAGKLEQLGDVELWGEKAYTFTLPCDRELHFKFQIKNTSNENRYVVFL